MWGKLRCQRGQAATELIVILPLFVMLVFGLIEVGKGYAYWVDQTHLAGETGRYAATEWFPGCTPPPAGTGLCNGQNLIQFEFGNTDTSELRNSSNATEAAGCNTTPPTPTQNAPGEVPCKLKISYCYPAGQDPTQLGKAGSILQVKLFSVYRIKVFDAFLGHHGHIDLQAKSTVRLERPVDFTRLGVNPAVGIPTCTS